MKSRTLFGLAGAFFLLFAAYIFLRSHNWAAAVLAGLAGAIFTLLGAMPERRR
jgi:membrane associated rhomboid family serine protease